ncbi:ABC transporter ATP-binding protein [Streptomyces sp. WAC05374]|uniref:ABC transporter ATP-binding protein n=1 Tax=Streptomyces sp. WAC05374 TaxID=2487420 RepID=UPI000F89387C|nr:ABC transporter ATP-binding protein [Streptomyces sp. WAC05374]RST13725.1 ABC transporter ATP-binding protein [Streptomyces sp. WAC05374]TDF54749.1 ABC transporter ATP-binding protein [Streptomyces sp. WAC05374]TDF56385.1 ABC transporter ATP-binding protein [Streptomyces sp. WAC05374]
MIRRLFTALGAQHDRALRKLLGRLTVAAVLQGTAYALLVPALRELLDGDPDKAWPWVIALAVLWIGYAAVHYAATLAGFRAGAHMSRDLHHRIGDKVARLPLAWFTGDRVGSLSRLASRRVLDIMGVPAHLLRQLVDSTVTPLVVILTVFLFDWRMAVSMSIAAVLAAVAYRLSGRRMQAADREADRIHSDAAGRIVEFARSQPVLRAFGRTVEGHAALDDALVAQHTADRRMQRAGLAGIVGLGFVAQASFLALLALGTHLALDGSLETAELVALLVLAVRFVEPVMMTAELGGAIRVAENALTEINDLLATATLPEPRTSRRAEGTDIELDDVRFGYDGAAVLNGLSMRVPQGRMTALVGPSGAGKTTVIKLMARFFDPEAGTVRVGGADVREMRTEDLTAAISVVFQDVRLFDGTILDNVRLGRPDASDEEVYAAARTARVDLIADRLPGGWDAPVGEGGSRLSGGERQRISIARAMLKNTPIVLFDEATAALDAENEHALHQAMAALSRDRTVLVIAHRMHTLREADHIVVLDGGRAVEEGVHDELLALGGRYAHYWRERRRAQGWRLREPVAPVHT